MPIAIDIIPINFTTISPTGPQTKQINPPGVRIIPPRNIIHAHAKFLIIIYLLLALNLDNKNL
jgi:hypothetical protein